MTILATLVQNGRKLPRRGLTEKKKDCISRQNRKVCTGFNVFPMHPSFTRRRRRMVARANDPTPPDDRRWRTIDLAMQRHDYRPDALIETLHAAQEAFGYLDSATLTYISSKLKTPPSKVFGGVTF